MKIVRYLPICLAFAQAKHTHGQGRGHITKHRQVHDIFSKLGGF